MIEQCPCIVVLIGTDGRTKPVVVKLVPVMVVAVVSATELPEVVMSPAPLRVPRIVEPALAQFIPVPLTFQDAPPAELPSEKDVA